MIPIINKIDYKEQHKMSNIPSPQKYINMKILGELSKVESNDSPIISKKEFIDLRKEGSASTLSDILNTIKKNTKMIQINIDIETLIGDEFFAEKIKLELISKINTVISGIEVRKTSPGAGILNKVEINTQIISK